MYEEEISFKEAEMIFSLDYNALSRVEGISSLIKKRLRENKINTVILKLKSLDKKLDNLLKTKIEITENDNKK